MVKRFRCSDVISFPAGNGSALAYNRVNQRAILLPASDLELLNRCDLFRTLDEHAQALASEVNNNPAAAPVGRFLKRLRDFAEKQGVNFEDQSRVELLGQKLQEFADAGLLISDRELLAKCEPQPDEQIVSVGVLTRNRPEFLSRCLNSYIENCKQDVDFVVVDDSEEASVRETNRQV